MKIIFISITFYLLSINNVYGQINLSTRQLVDNIIIYRDVNDSIFYYVPNDLQLKKNANGKPEFKFIRATYTGEHDRGDYETIFNFHNIAFTVESIPYDKSTLNSLRQILFINKPDNLKVLPLAKMEAALAVPLENGSTQIIRGGFFENERDGTTWQQRHFSMNLDLLEGKLAWDAFWSGNSLVSLVYGYYIRGAAGESLFLHQDTTLATYFTSSASDTVTNKYSLVHGNALTIAIDLEKFPDLMKHDDLNTPSQVVNYSVLNILYNDLLDGCADHIWEKNIEIKAVGFGKTWGNEVYEQFTFSSENPNVNLKRLHFKYPVRTDKPFQLRITDYYHDGSSKQGEWQLIRSWKMLDLSSH